MYKLKNSYIDKMIAAKISKSEIAFLLHIAVSQDDSGKVHSVYYKDVCAALNISIQKFYDILNSLSGKNLIKCEKVNPADFVVQLLGNDFSSKNFNCGYLNVESKEFHTKTFIDKKTGQEIKFTDLKAGAQLLYLYTQRFTNGKHMGVQKFYEDFCKMFQVTRKTLQIYLQQLKDIHLLFISKKRNKAYHYEMTMKKSTCLDKKGIIPNEKSGYVDNIKRLLRANFKRYLSDDSDKAIADIAAMITTKRAEKYRNFIPLIVAATRASIKRQKDEKKEHVSINAALVNKCLTEAIERFFMHNSIDADKEIVDILCKA